MRFLHSAPSSVGGRRVFIAIPTYRDLPAITVHSLVGSIGVLERAGISAEVCILSGHCHVDDARNALVGRFLASGCDELVFIDADMGWQPEDLARLISHDRDVVAGVYRQKTDAPIYPAWLKPGDIVADADGLIEAEAVATGFLKLSRACLETMAERSNTYRPEVDSERADPEVFFRSTIEGHRWGGDFTFCRRWRDAGGRIFVDPELWLEHIGEQVWRGSFGCHLRQVNGLDLVRWIDRIRAGTFEREDLIPLSVEYGNEGYTAGVELLAFCLDAARQAKGPIIETGSGLSSLVMAAAGAVVFALESDPVWLTVLESHRVRLGLDSLRIIYAPLEDYRDGRWYARKPVELLPWSTADIVVCDGPARRLGDREILFRTMRETGARPRIVLVDDVGSIALPDELEFETIGTLRKFGVGRQRKQERAA